MRAFAGRIVCKGGAEGLEAIGFSDPPLGIAVKVLDGGERAGPPIVLAVLRALGTRSPARRPSPWPRSSARYLTNPNQEKSRPAFRGSAPMIRSEGRKRWRAILAHHMGPQARPSGR